MGMTRGGSFVAFYGSAIGGFSTSNKLVSAAGQTIDFRPGRTLWAVVQTIGTIASTTETILACVSGTFGSGKGFWFVRAGAASGATQGHFYCLSPGNLAVDLGTANAPGSSGFCVLCLVWRASDNAMLVSLSGGPLASAGTLGSTPADASCVSYLGGPEAGLGSVALTSSRVLALAVWSSEATSAQALAATFTQGNRFALPSSVTGDAHCTFNFLASRDFANGATSVTTLGSAPVTFTVSGSPLLTTVAERRIVASLYADSRRAELLTDGSGYSYTRRDTYGRTRVTTDALSIGVETYSTMYTTFPAQATIGLYKNLAFVSQTAMRQAGAPQILELQPGSGSAKTVDVWEGEQDMTGGTTRVGTFIQAIRVPLLLSDGVTGTNTSVPVVTAPQKRLVLIGDSILTGFFASVPMQTALPALLRADYPTSGTGGVTCAVAGTDSAHNEASDTATANAFAALIAAECDGTVSNTVWIQLGTNDYGFLARSAAAFAVEYARLVDAIHAAVSGAALYLQSPIQRIAPSTEAANGAGSTLGDFRTAISTIASARSGWATYVEGGAAAIVSNANIYTDGLHLIDAGFVQYKAFIKTTLAY